MSTLARFGLLAVALGVYLGSIVACAPHLYRINHYVFVVPPGYEVQDVSPEMMDYQILNIRNTADPIAVFRIYFGNHPRFPIFEWDVPPVEKSLGKDCTMRMFEYRERDGAIEGVLHFTGLSYKDLSISPYTCVHFFAQGIDKASAEQLMTVVSGLRVAEPHLE